MLLASSYYVGRRFSTLHSASWNISTWNCRECNSPTISANKWAFPVSTSSAEIELTHNTRSRTLLGRSIGASIAFRNASCNTCVATLLNVALLTVRTITVATATSEAVYDGATHATFLFGLHSEKNRIITIFFIYFYSSESDVSPIATENSITRTKFLYSPLRKSSSSARCLIFRGLRSSISL